MLNNVNYDIDITKEPPADDTARQYYFIEKAKASTMRMAYPCTIWPY